MSSNVNVTNLNFDDIKTGLKDYISNKSEFKDYNFEGSTLSMLLDLLAYNTYQTAYYTSMVGNEMFLDSAQIRNNVVSRAKMLGYTPRSAQGASTTIDIEVTPNDSPDAVTIGQSTEFTATVDGIDYKFVTPTTYTVQKDTNGKFTSTITVVEGQPITQKYDVSTNNPARYLISNANVDLRSLDVKVQTSSSNQTLTSFVKAEDIVEVNNSSNVYYLKEVEDSLYEIYFGDGILGTSLDNGNIVIVNYRVCNGSIGNSISSLEAPTTLGGYSSFTFSVNTETSGGSAQENIESIKFNAPKTFSTQNRAVLAEDYKRLVLSSRGDIATMRVWGGEQNDPPVYGKVFVSAKPKEGVILAESIKEEIKAHLKKYNVMSIDVEFVDPTFLYIIPSVVVNFDSSKTTYTAEEIRTFVYNNILDFEQNNLGTFDNEIFRYSKFVEVVDKSENSILSNTTKLKLEKRFKPSFITKTKYTIYFANSVTPSSISSSGFTYDNKTCYFDDDGLGKIRIFYIDAVNSKVYLENNAGSIDYSIGIITLDSFLPTAATGDEISINSVPVDNNVKTERYQLMLLGGVDLTMYDENTFETTNTVTVTTEGSVTKIEESGLGTIV